MANHFISLQELQKSQPQAVTAFQNAVSSNRRHHAYLVTCSQSQTSHNMVHALSLLLACHNHQTGRACEQCSGCKKVINGSHPDLLLLQPNDQQKITITQIRELLQRLSLRPVQAAQNIVIILEADSMNTSAQNALLKTLEEPSGHACFLLTARRYRSLLPTVRSRIQRIQLRPQSTESTKEILVQAGIPPNLVSSLASLVGSDAEKAQAHLDSGANEILNNLTTLLKSPNYTNLLQLASEYGSDKTKTQIVLALLEVLARDGLAKKWGARANQLHTSPSDGIVNHNFDAAAQQLQLLRGNRTINPNNTMSIESTLFELMQFSLQIKAT